MGEFATRNWTPEREKVTVGRGCCRCGFRCCGLEVAAELYAAVGAAPPSFWSLSMARVSLELPSKLSLLCSWFLSLYDELFCSENFFNRCSVMLLMNLLHFCDKFELRFLHVVFEVAVITAEMVWSCGCGCR
ncbi:uncharacterized protein DS421_13g421100 [Arachis hypogaea]|nr:uncharacterized protein DS421_13g421100 [Arachis hypogaea]